MENCIFCKIAAKEIPSKILYEDDEIVIFPDIHPRAKIHLLLVPKTHFKNTLDMNKEQSEILARALMTLARIREQLNLPDGYRLVINNGETAGQEVPHCHIHIML